MPSDARLLRSIGAGLLVVLLLLPLVRPGSGIDLLSIGATGIIVFALFNTFDDSDQDE